MGASVDQALKRQGPILSRLGVTLAGGAVGAAHVERFANQRLEEKAPRAERGLVERGKLNASAMRTR